MFLCYLLQLLAMVVRTGPEVWTRSGFCVDSELFVLSKLDNAGLRHVPVSEFVLITELVVRFRTRSEFAWWSFHMQLVFCYLQWDVSVFANCWGRRGTAVMITHSLHPWSAYIDHDHSLITIMIIHRSWSWSYFIRRLSFLCNQCWLTSSATKTFMKLRVKTLPLLVAT